MKEFYKFKKGQTVHLDDVYKILGLIPQEAYHQDDPSDATFDNNNDYGESVRFLKKVTIKINVTVA